MTGSGTGSIPQPARTPSHSRRIARQLVMPANMSAGSATRAEIRRAADGGYTVFKVHTCAYHDVFEQTRQAAAAAAGGEASGV